MVVRRENVQKGNQKERDRERTTESEGGTKGGSEAGAEQLGLAATGQMSQLQASKRRDEKASAPVLHFNVKGKDKQRKKSLEEL